MGTTREIPLEGGPLAFAGAVALERVEGGVMRWRIAVERRERFEPELRKRAIMPSGVRLTFASDAPWVEVELRPHAHAGEYGLRYWTVDLCIDGRLHERVTRPTGDGAIR